MEFLKEVLGEELYNQFVLAVNAYNGDEAHKDKQVKIANLGTGEYVSKGKYDGLNATLSGKQSELDAANGLIAEFKKGTKGSEEMQTKITTYESTIADLQKELTETKIKSAVQVGLIGANALDVDYLTYKLREKLAENNETLELDENDSIKGWNEKLEGLKVQFPTQFTSSGAKKIEEHKLEGGDGSKTYTRADILKMPYAERVKMYEENPDGYNEAMKK